MYHSRPKLEIYENLRLCILRLYFINHPEDVGVGLFMKVVREAYFLAEYFDHFDVTTLEFTIFHVDIWSGSGHPNGQRI